MGDNKVVLNRLSDRAKTGIASFGSYWPKGSLKECEAFRIVDNTNDIQSRILAYWPDGSIKWAGHVFECNDAPDEIAIEAVTGGKGKIDNYSGDGFIAIAETNDYYKLIFPNGELKVAKSGQNIIKDYIRDGEEIIGTAYSELLLEHRSSEKDGIYDISIERYKGNIQKTTIKEIGSVRAVIRIEGIHESVNDRNRKIPFVIYIEAYKKRPELRFEYTFLWDADEYKDFLKGIGIRFETGILSGSPMYNRHIKYGVDNGFFHEQVAQLLTWHPRLNNSIYHTQAIGRKLLLDEDKDADAIKASKDMPFWGEYSLWQKDSMGYVIRKKISKNNCCYIEGLHGQRAPGTMSIGGEKGYITLAYKDFWQKYPSSLSVLGLDKDKATISVWLWSPESEAMDFRHYTDSAYSQSYYEGFDDFGATAYGIGNTSEFMISAVTDNKDSMIATDTQMEDLYREVNTRCIYVHDAGYLHDNKAFGYWSLRKEGACDKLEQYLDKAFDFYKNEVDLRNWYGMFDYGDVMHTYDKERHTWRYDMGGYAWQNTELVPTMWLWYYFLRTGRSDVFRMAQAMSIHCSEVDTYHLGKLKGLGSRHNVRHWGCPCKEARIAMAGHHRFMYYLTGDYRLEDVFEDVKDADFSTVNMDPLRYFFDKEKMIYPTHARSGPDWSSFCSNWLTQWERKNDSAYEAKIRVGIEDLKETPMKLVSGSDFEYDPKSSHLRYIGDRATGGTHLEICQGAEQTWLELTDLLDDEEFNKMLADFGCFYPMSHEKQFSLTNGMIQNRQFTYPYMAAGVIAYGAHYYGDHELGHKVWDILSSAVQKELGDSGFEIFDIKNAGNKEHLHEMPGISTNTIAQWCLNVIVALEFVRDDIDANFRI